MSQQLQQVRDVREEEVPVRTFAEGAVRGSVGGGTGSFPKPALQTAYLRLERFLSAEEFSALEDPPFCFSLEHLFKRCFDITGALVLALIFSPLIAMILIAMLSSGGAPIFRHTRVGLNGELFKCLKFRTMVPNAEQVLHDVLNSDRALREEWGRDHKLRIDPRVTRMGRFLRSTSLDELPQLWNVMRGEMSLVGPRPVTREELLRYGRNMVLYIMVKPGITGLWQVSGRSETDYRRRVAIDVCYVRNQDFLLDLWILMKTALVIMGRRGAC